MLPSSKLFENVFKSGRITPMRISNYTVDNISRVETIDTDRIFKVSLDAVKAAHIPFHMGLSSIDTSLGIKKGKTKNVKQVRTAFGVYLSSYEGEITRALGGKTTADYAAFYPHGIMEYTGATKAEMPLLVQRIDTLATSFASKLGEAITQQLQSFILLWQAALGEESSVKSGLSDDRSDRGTLRNNLELALTNLLHLVAAQYPGDVAKCMAFFDFNLLTGNSAKTVVTPPAAPTV